MLALCLLFLVSCHALNDCSLNTSACSTGYRCSLTAGGLCVPCDAGLYCPAATYVANEANLSSIICPSGYYCLNASSMLICPAGYFCTEGTVQPTSCSLYSLLAAQPTTSLSRDPTTVLALAETGKPIMSNICLAGSSSVSSCPEGYYCPNASSVVICPQGYYCKAYSTAPTKCPSVLTSCPEGTSTPSRSYLAFVIAGIVCLSLWPLHFGLQYVDSKFIIRQNPEKEKKPAVLKMKKSMKISSEIFKSSSTQTSVLSSKGTSSTDHYKAFRKISPSLTISYENVSLTLRSQVILAKVSGKFQGGKINAIMGPSGSGKTTFLSLISGRINFACTISGSVQVNGEEADYSVLSKITGFVPQDDIVHPDLTVIENLSFAASLKLPLHTNNVKMRRLYVEDALAILQLGHVQHKIVGSVESRGISGGQRKRVSIGLELVGSPSILFLDVSQRVITSSIIFLMCQ